MAAYTANDLFIAVRDDDLNLVKRIIGTGVDPGADDSYVFDMAARRGHLDIVKYLATLPEINPAANNSYAFRMAAEDQHLDILKILATLPGVNPAARNNIALRHAAFHGNLSIVKFLISLPGVDAAIDTAIKDARNQHHTDVVDFLEQYKFNTTAGGNQAYTAKDLLDAIENADLNLVKQIVESGVDPSTKESSLFRAAVDRGHLDIVKYLASLPKIDPTARFNRALEFAATNGDLDIVKFLVTLPGVESGIPGAIGYARNEGHADVVDFLEQYTETPQIEGHPTITSVETIPFTMDEMPDLS